MGRNTHIQYITAETELGRSAIKEVMQYSYGANINNAAPQWSFARIVDDVPVSFIIVSPERWMDFPGGDIRYAFINDVATREDQRMKGHFRGIMEHAFSRLHNAGIYAVVTHGEYKLYRRFGFNVFTHHCGIFANPDLIEKKLGLQVSDMAHELVVIDNGDYVRDDLLLITKVKAKNATECKMALQASAIIARELGKQRIFFEYPPAPSYGSRYPIYDSLGTLFAELAAGCGCQIFIKGSDPESESIPDADWVKILNPAGFVREVLTRSEKIKGSFLEGAICLDTDAGQVAIEISNGRIIVREGIKPCHEVIKIPSSALAQLVTGYQSAEVLCAIHEIDISSEALDLLNALFPHQWRLSRNESWVFQTCDRL